MAEDNTILSRRLLEECFSRGDLSVADEVLDANSILHDPAQPGPIEGAAGFKQLVNMYRTAFPDLQFTLNDVLSASDRVITRWTARGTHRGTLQGIPPTGKSTTVTGITIDRCANGKIVESYTNWDTLGLMQQLGVIPTMSATTGAEAQPQQPQH
jgi:steroid delta-isomerase-like uncharacterized protein